MKHCRSHGQTETGYARHRRPTAFEDKMIGQEVNSLAQKLLRSARRKRGALQGVNVLNCSHVVPTSSATPHLLFLAAVEYGAAGGASERARRAHCKRERTALPFRDTKTNPELCLSTILRASIILVSR